MRLRDSTIQPLAADVRAQIKSAVSITTLNEVVLGLIKNSLDAQADRLEVALDYKRGYCKVADNGEGIDERNFTEHGGLGKMFNSSRTLSKDFYGSSGRFIASLGSVSLLSINSRSATSTNTQSLTIGFAKRLEAIPGDNTINSEHGTTILVRSLFANLPVRLSHCTSKFDRPLVVDKEFQSLKRELVGSQLVHPTAFELRVREQSELSYDVFAKSSPIRFDLDRTADILYGAGYTSKEDRSNWRGASAKTSTVAIRAAVSLTPAPSKRVQFVSVGRYVLPEENVFGDAVNAIFERSSFGVVEDSETELARRGKGGRSKKEQHKKTSCKGVDRWPMFYLRIDLSHRPNWIDSTMTDEMELHDMHQVLQSLLERFLEAHGFQNLDGRRRNSIHQAQLRSGSKVWRQVKPGDRQSEEQQKGTSEQSINQSSLLDSDNEEDTKILIGLTSMEESLLKIREQSSKAYQVEVGKRALVELSSLLDPLESDASVSQLGCLPSDDESTTVSWVDMFGKDIKLDARTGSMCLPTPFVGGAESSATTKPNNPTLSELQPCFRPSEPVIPSMVAARNSDRTCTIGKDDLIHGQVIGQIEKKFIMVKTPSGMLALVDQHAADERVKVETLLLEISTAQIVALRPPMMFNVSQLERPKYCEWRNAFDQWGIQYKVQENLVVEALPALIAERCRAEPKVLIELIRKAIWTPVPVVKSGDWFARLATCPSGLIDLVNSRACRTAIMFGDELSKEECGDLIGRLGKCHLPFQCAHGRPTLVVLGRACV